MTQIIPPFIAPDDETDDGKWLQFTGGRIVAMPMSVPAADVPVGVIVGSTATNVQQALVELYARVALLAPLALPIRTLAVAGVLSPSTDGMLLIDATASDITVTLVPPTAGQRTWFFVQKTDSSANHVALDADATTVNGLDAVYLDAQREAALLVYDTSNANWRAMSLSGDADDLLGS